MTIQSIQTELTNWSKSEYSACYVYKAGDAKEIIQALETARAYHLSVIPHGAGHSYTDAALNSSNMVIDVSPMRQILMLDSAQGIMCVEPGVTLGDMARMAWEHGWWPVVSPSTPEVTIGGCAAMNVNGRNAWKCGPFGAHILSLDVMLVNGEVKTLLPQRDAQLFQAIVGSMGLLGIITSITIQLQRISSGYVNVRKRSANSLEEIFALFAEEESKSDFMEAWLDGFAGGSQLGRGRLTSATLCKSGEETLPQFQTSGILDQIESSLAANLARPILLPNIQTANRVYQWLGQRSRTITEHRRPLFPYTFWPSAAFAVYHAMFPEGIEAFQAFVPRQEAREIFRKVLCYSRQQGFMPIWCIIKQHQRDPFLLSYQVDGFSLELNYRRTRQTAAALKQTLQHMIAIVIEAGGRFYFAKDHFLTHKQYRQSMGDESIASFLRLKKCYDPEMVLQSDLFRRIFQPPL
jgi:decaprenylphospho-beta-D-ribofuranose 2-oxidase